MMKLIKFEIYVRVTACEARSCRVLLGGVGLCTGARKTYVTLYVYVRCSVAHAPDPENAAFVTILVPCFATLSVTLKPRQLKRCKEVINKCGTHVWGAKVAGIAPQAS